MAHPGAARSNVNGAVYSFGLEYSGLSADSLECSKAGKCISDQLWGWRIHGDGELACCTRCTRTRSRSRTSRIALAGVATVPPRGQPFIATTLRPKPITADPGD